MFKHISAMKFSLMCMSLFLSHRRRTESIYFKRLWEIRCVEQNHSAKVIINWKFVHQYHRQFSKMSYNLERRKENGRAKNKIALTNKVGFAERCHPFESNRPEKKTVENINSNNVNNVIRFARVCLCVVAYDFARVSFSYCIIHTKWMLLIRTNKTSSSRIRMSGDAVVSFHQFALLLYHKIYNERISHITVAQCSICCE